MKTLLLITAIFITSFTAFSQNEIPENFKVENGDIVWQKVYNDVDIKNVASITAQLTDVTVSDDLIIGKLQDVDVDYESQGFKRGQMSIFMCYPYCADIQIEKKDNRYRVTANNIRFVNYRTALRSSLQKKYDPLRDFYVVDGRIKNSKKAIRNLNIIDVEFTNRFTINETNNDW